MIAPLPPLDPRRSHVVVGAGVSGLSVGLELLAAGRAVVVATAEAPSDTTSAVAAAIWHPFFQEPDESYLRRAHRTFECLTALAAERDAGITSRPLTEFFREELPAPWWAKRLAPRPVPREALPAGRGCGWQVTVPVADTSRYLPWLERRFVAAGGVLVRYPVRDLAALARQASVVVNCTGFAATTLAGDRSMTLLRGLVLRTTKDPRIAGCLIDDSDPHAPTYLIEREDDMILGGTADPSCTATAVPAETVCDIQRRCAALHPAAAQLRVLEARVGFRPVREVPRIEVDADIPNLVHDYGHGGAGYTLSWGAAEDVRRLVEAIAPPVRDAPQPA